MKDTIDNFDDYGDDVKDTASNFNPQDLYNESYYDNSFSDYGIAPMQQHNDLLKGLMGFENNIQQLKLIWLGLQWNPNLNRGKGGYEKNPFARPMINPKGWQRCEEIMRTYLKESNFLTHLGEKEFCGLMRDVIMDIWFAFPFHMKEYGITNLEDLYAICTQIEHTVQLMLLGAGQGGYKKFLEGTTSRNENISSMPGSMPYGYERPGFEFANQNKNKGVVSKMTDWIMGRK